jgi:AcrR family transcriptional regulator
MTPKKGTDHKRPAALNKERILRAAIALADKNGIESLSMRKLAQELGFEVMSLYNHVRRNCRSRGKRDRTPI